MHSVTDLPILPVLSGCQLNEFSKVVSYFLIALDYVLFVVEEMLPMDSGHAQSIVQICQDVASLLMTCMYVCSYV
jgi:hypothetical protein